ncbi:hypothetical protein F511_14262 [Dorcoceras hygrometricum]|uniref:Uncharacterized protein n=1 Tax=Dorcoceras hygrometricum TaxID=472368 RepID=A0A2Z7BPF8_9LAMI|nr:hypothetical protein F511_14262 [Dorcoceras hygrometricum]
MHARHRNGPGNGYWSNVMSMRGQAATSRMSPEGSMRGHRMYGSEHRNNHGGFVRGGHSRQFQPPLPPSHGIDIFMEAGRLAAEYLVAKGALPPNALSGKLKNGGLKNQLGRLHVFRPHEVDMQIPMDSRPPDNTHLGNAALEIGPTRRRNSVDDNSMDGSRNSMRGRRRMGSFKNQGPEVNAGSGKSVGWADRSRDLPGIGAESDASSGQHADQPVDVDGHGRKQTSSLGEVVQEGNGAANLPSEFERHYSTEDAGAKGNTSSAEKFLSADAKVEATKDSDDAAKSDTGSEEAKEGRNVNDLEILQNENENTDYTGDTLAIKDNVDLLKHFIFPRIPTKARSSLKLKGSKGGQDTMNEDDKVTGREIPGGSEVHVVDVPDEISSGNLSSCKIHELNSLDSDVQKTPGIDDEQPIAYMIRSGRSRSTCVPEQSMFKGQKELDEGLSVVGCSNSMSMNIGLKRPIDDATNGKEDFKKLRECSPIDTEANGYLPLSSSIETQPTLQEPRISQSSQLALSPDQKNFSVSPFPESRNDSCVFTGFKTCDLNLSGTCDAGESDNAERVLIFPSAVETGKEAAPVDFGLSMNNSCNVPNKNARLAVSNNNIEVIDLEIDSGQEDNIFSHPEKRADSVFTDLDGFPNNLHSANEITDVQDGYGLMFSDLLGNHSPHSSSVPTDINTLHSEMGLPNGEGILGDDDSIYMSLGEIPISMRHASI